MTYTRRSEGASEDRAERKKQTMTRGILTYRRGITGISAKLRALRSEMDHEIIQAIHAGLAVRTVDSAAGVHVAEAIAVELPFENRPQSAAMASSRIETLRALNQQMRTLLAQLEEMRRQQEQLIVTALQVGRLGPPWIAAASGLPLEKIEALERAGPEWKLVEPAADAQK